MNFKKILHELNVISQCRRYGLELWQCPQFLILVMGAIICLTSIGSFAIGTRYVADPTMVALIVLLIAAILLIISFSIIQGFEKLADANRMKSEFIGIVSHQLRSPISNLSWALEFLMSGKEAEVTGKQAEYFKILKENILRMNELVSDLLIVSRIQTATLPLRKEGFSLVNLTEEMIHEFKSFAQASNIKLKLDFKKDLPTAFADPSQIKQVIENLIDNAIRYTEGKGEAKVRIEKRASNLYFEIRDTGVGIPKEDQKYIFQKFFRSRNVLRYQTQGSGLGLFIAKSIVERSGGKIGFESQEGKGTKFWFTLPIKKHQ